MLPYSLIRPLLFSLSPESAHHLSLQALKWSMHGPIAQFMRRQVEQKPVNVMGIDFPNPVGLAAGLDKNGDYINALASLGFGFIEIGTITPRPQAGNPKPRLFRIRESEAIINRMGFNNKGIDYLVRQVEQTQFAGILGINIGKNKDTPAEQSVDDYLHCLQKAYAYASYITVNISSPNTPGLRDLQQEAALAALLNTLLDARESLQTQHSKYVPLVLKVAPDLDEAHIDSIANTLLNHRIDGLIISNTTLSRPTLEHNTLAAEQGGLSGKPLMPLSTKVLSAMQQRLNGSIPLIGVGGISSASDAKTKFAAGASLVQLYSGLIYQGPALIKAVASAAP